MTDEELVAQEVAELACWHGEQARAERLLLEKLPADVAAAILREGTLDQLARPLGGGSGSVLWYRYLRLEAAWAHAQGWGQEWGPSWRQSMWKLLVGSDDPVQLIYARAAFRYDQPAKEESP